LNKVVEKKEKKILHKTGSSAVTNTLFEKKEKEKGKETLLQHGVIVFDNPSKRKPRQIRLNVIERTRRGW